MHYIGGRGHKGIRIEAAGGDLLILLPEKGEIEVFIFIESISITDCKRRTLGIARRGSASPGRGNQVESNFPARRKSRTPPPCNASSLVVPRGCAKFDNIPVMPVMSVM